MITNDELIKIAESVLNPYTTHGGRLFGDVGAALLSEGGNLYTGVCIDTPGWGLCAERSAMAAMITNREYRIRKIVSVWRDEKTGKLHVMPPCGACREFIRQVDQANLEAEVILGRDKSARLKDLLPYCEWPDPMDWSM